MAITRKMLKAMGIEDEKIEQIIEAHTETVEGLKEKAEENAEAVKNLAKVQKELDDAKKDIEAMKKDSYKVKYDAIKEEFEEYKNGIEKKETRNAKEKAYRELLKEAGISEKRIEAVLKVSDVDGVELEDGKIKDAAKLTENIKTEWADFIVKTETKGADPATPPAHSGSGAKTKDEIMAIKDRSERRAAIAENLELFGGNK